MLHISMTTAHYKLEEDRLIANLARDTSVNIYKPHIRTTLQCVAQEICLLASSSSPLPSPLTSRLPSLHPPPTAIQLTPSLSRLYREQLIGHVLAWPAEQVERAINKVGEDANTISNHTITKVSTGYYHDVKA